MSNKPDMIKPERYSTLNEAKKQIKATGLTKKDLGLAGFGIGISALALKGLKDSKKSKVKPPVSKPKFSNIEVPVGKPPQTRKPQTLKTESQTFTKKQRPGRSKKETVKVNVVN